MTRPIDCALHDHIEVACLYRYELRAILDDGAVLTGRAVTTATLKDKTETLELEVDGTAVLIPLHHLRRIDVLTAGAPFSSIDFPAES